MNAMKRDLFSFVKSYKAIKIQTIRKIIPRSHLPLASARDVGIFALFDLPDELVVAIISEMVSVVGFYRAVRLRFINKFFDEAITKIIFSSHNASFLPGDTSWPRQRTARVAFTKVLVTKFEKEARTRSTLNQAIHSCIDLLDSLPLSPQHRSEVTKQRQSFVGKLCACTINVLSMETAISLTSTELRMEEAPSKGALTLASAMGDTVLINALCVQGASPSDRSDFFCSPFEAAGEYRQTDAVKELMKYSAPEPDHIFRAIRGGHVDTVKLFLEKCYSDMYCSLALHEPLALVEPISDEYGKLRKMVFSAVANDQLPLIDMLLELIPHQYREKVMEGALYNAVRYYSMSIIASRLNGDIKHSGGYSSGDYIDMYPTLLHIASARGDIEILRLFTKGQEQYPGLYGSCMHYAAVKGHTNIVQLFLDRGVDLNGKFDCDLNRHVGILQPDLPALLHAAARDDFHTFCFLIRKGASVDQSQYYFVLVQRQWLKQIQAWESEAPYWQQTCIKLAK